MLRLESRVAGAVRAGLLLFLGASLSAQQAPKAVQALPVIEEEEPVKAAKPGAPVVDEEAPAKPPKAGAPVVEEDEPSQLTKSTGPAVPKQASSATPTADEEDKGDSMLQAPSVISMPRLDLRLFADVGYAFERKKGERTENGFSIGAFDLFASSKLSDKVTVMVEALFERDGGEYLVDVERMVLRFKQSRYLSVDAGRFHSSISYYNSNYHHGRWFETTAERPLIAEWEDDKGVLPSHGVGVQVSGALPSPEGLALSYSFELTNGRGFTAGKNEVLSGGDNNGFKATNIGLVVKPARLPGLQAGISMYNDRFDGTSETRWAERIYSAHAVYQRGAIQFLSELIHMAHRPVSSFAAVAPSASEINSQGFNRRSTISGFYSQFGYRIGKLVPYTRFDWLNARRGNPIATAAFGDDTGLRKEVAGGLFYDLSSFSALKVQVNRFWLRGVPKFETIVQLAFAF